MLALEQLAQLMAETENLRHADSTQMDQFHQLCEILDVTHET